MPETAENRLEQAVLSRFGFSSGIAWEYHTDQQPVAHGKTWVRSDIEARTKAEEARVRLVRGKVERAAAGYLVVQGALHDSNPYLGSALIEVFVGEWPDEEP